MVVKIPTVLIKRAKTAASEEIIETPNTKATNVTPEKKEPPCKFAAAASAAKKQTTTTNKTSNADDDANVGDNSSISSRSSMNSMPSVDRGDTSRIEGVNSTSYAAALKAAATASTRPSSEDAVTVSSPSDHSREHIDHPYASPESLLLEDVSVCVLIMYSAFTVYIVYFYSC